MEENCKKCCGNFDPNTPQSREFLRRFQKLSEKDRQDLINSICKNKSTAEEASQAFENIVSLLRDNEQSRSLMNKFKWESEDYEEEEEEEEESDNEGSTCNKCDKRKSESIHIFFYIPNHAILSSHRNI